MRGSEAAAASELGRRRAALSRPESHAVFDDRGQVFGSFECKEKMLSFKNGLCIRDLRYSKLFPFSLFEAVHSTACLEPTALLSFDSKCISIRFIGKMNFQSSHKISFSHILIFSRGRTEAQKHKANDPRSYS